MVVQHDAHIQQPKREGGKREEIHGYHLAEVIVQEAFPGLGTAALGWADDVFANRPLGDAEAQFQQFPVITRIARASVFSQIATRHSRRSREPRRRQASRRRRLAATRAL